MAEELENLTGTIEEITYRNESTGFAVVELDAGDEYVTVVGVLGSEKYYPKFGYQPAQKAGIVPPFDVPDENFMMCRLSDEFEHVSGVVKYSRNSEYKE